MITRIRGLVNQEPMRRTPLVINDVIRDVAALSDRMLRQRHVELHLELAADLPRVRGDRIQLQQVLLNLVVNGADAMRSVGGRTRALAISSSQRNGHVTVAVVDSEAVCPRRSLRRFSRRSLRRSRRGWGSGSRSAARSSRPTEEASS